MSENRIDNPQRGPDCSCGGITWERLDSTGYYYQCEQCGECVEYKLGAQQAIHIYNRHHEGHCVSVRPLVGAESGREYLERLAYLAAAADNLIARRRYRRQLARIRAALCPFGPECECNAWNIQMI